MSTIEGIMPIKNLAGSRSANPPIFGFNLYIICENMYFSTFFAKNWLEKKFFSYNIDMGFLVPADK
jgi:hypothetical protein